MADTHRQIAQLSKQLAELETRLGEAAGSLAELHNLMAPFLARYRREVLDPLEELVRVEREVADLRALLGDRRALEPGEVASPLSRLKRENLPVEEQYQRTWLSRSTTKPITPEDLPPATAEVKTLYARLVSQIHPELARRPEDKARFTELMQQANEAYIQRDQVKLQQLVDGLRERSNLPVVATQDALCQLRERIIDLETLAAYLEGQYFELRYGDVGKVRAQAEQVKAENRDLLREFGDEIEAAIRNKYREMEELRQQIQQRKGGGAYGAT